MGLSLSTTSESLDDVREQLREGSKKFADRLKFSQCRLP